MRKVHLLLECTLFFYLYILETVTFDHLLEQFQVTLYAAYSCENPGILYDLVEMKKSADKAAPGLFDMILHSILRNDSRLSEEHHLLQEKNCCVDAHYCLFQVVIIANLLFLKITQVVNFHLHAQKFIKMQKQA